MIKQKQNFKVALIGDCLSDGGAEKVHAMLSRYFEKMGLDVHNCIIADKVSYAYSGTLLNLGRVGDKGSYYSRKLSKFRALRKFIHDGGFDAVIDFRIRNNFLLELLLSRFVYPENTYYTVHSGILNYYFPGNAILSRLVYGSRNIVAVSSALSKRILQQRLARYVKFIYNPIDSAEISGLKEEFAVAGNFILAAGRMNEQVKQFGELIACYASSDLPRNGIRLVILGEGKFRKRYEQQAKDLGVDEVVEFKGFVPNPYPFYANALFYVLSSRNEGFPNVLTESLGCGTPVVSFDCFSGPAEIVIDGQNGILVADQDFAALTQALNKLAEDKELYQHCKSNAAASSETFELEKIGREWLRILKIDVS